MAKLDGKDSIFVKKNIAVQKWRKNVLKTFSDNG